MLCYAPKKKIFAEDIAQALDVNVGFLEKTWLEWKFLEKPRVLKIVRRKRLMALFLIYFKNIILLFIIKLVVLSLILKPTSVICVIKIAK